VLDTNIVVSAWISIGAERAVLNHARRRHFDLAIPQVVVDELRDVMPRKFYWSNQQLEHSLTQLVGVGELVSSLNRVDVIQGEDADNQILACAVEHGADYLVTGDRKHLLPLGEFEGVKILRAPEFLALLSSDD
jgi:putative PIN family toxin of toxin-antitoxin system